MWRIIILCLGLGTMGFVEAQSPYGRVSTSADAIFVDGKPLFLEGVDYSPYVAGDAPGGPIGNQAPLELTPKVSPSGVSRGSAISTSS